MSRLDSLNRCLLEHPDGPALHARERALSKSREFVVLDQGKVRVIELLLRPRLMRREQMAHLAAVARAVSAVQTRVASRYFADPRLQRALPLPEDEREVFAQVFRSKAAFRAPVVSRLDASIALERRSWREDLRLFEVNSVGVGGLFLTPVAQRILRDISFPLFRGVEGFRARTGPDLRLALARTLRELGVRLGHPRPVVALVEERDDLDGTVEFESLHRFFAARGVEVVLADVRSVRYGRRGLEAGGKRVDVLYRDAELAELLELTTPGLKATFARAFAEGRVVSPLQGDLDHKSLWEVLTDPELSEYVRPRERRVLGQAPLWTRLLYPRKTTDPQGKTVDLERLLRSQRRAFVLKPNREYGGEGVTPGLDVTAAEWDRALTRAFSRPGTWVAQALGEVMVEHFPVLGPHGAAVRPYYVDCGVYQVGRSYGILTRAARRRVVNVSSGGGYAVMFFD